MNSECLKLSKLPKEDKDALIKNVFEFKHLLDLKKGDLK